MTDDLVQWLRDQLDEDEQLARACSGDGKWDERDIAIYGPGLGVEVLAHMARHDPARVLREIDAKRKIIAAHPATRDVISVAPDGQHGFGCATCHQDEGMIIGYGWCATLRALALSYADRPDYRPETE